MSATKKIVLLFVLGFIFSASALWGQGNGNGNGNGGGNIVTEEVNRRYFIKLKENVPQTVVDKLLEDLNSVEIWKHEGTRLRLWSVQTFPYTSSEGEVIFNLEEHLARSQKKTEVDGSQSDSDSQGDTSNGNSNSPGNNVLDGLRLYAPLGNNPIKISIIDTGVSDLTDNNLLYNFGLSSYSGYDYVNNDSDPEDEHGHGSHIAGLVHHIVYHEGWVDHIDFDIKKAFKTRGTARMSALTLAILEAVDEGADIINMSFSVSNVSSLELLDPLKTAIGYAEANGVLVVAAAGNDAINNDDDQGEDGSASTQAAYPASFPFENIIAVASLNDKNALSSFSNYGFNLVDVGILGENIPGPDLADGIAYKNGTSFSAAMVTAMAAILGSHQSQFDYHQIKCVLINLSKESKRLHGKIRSEGVIDFPAALNALSAGCDLNVPAAKYTDLDMAWNNQTTSGMSSPPTATAGKDRSHLGAFRTASHQPNRGRPEVSAGEGYRAYPNPFTDVIRISARLQQDERLSIAVYDELGRRLILKSRELQQGYHTLEISELNDLTPGAYFIRITTSEQTISRKMIKR